MSWLIIAVSAYFLLAVCSLIDKYLLSGPLPVPEAYTFYLGILEGLALILIPFVGFSVPRPFQIFLSFLSGAAFVYAIFWYTKALRRFEASRVVPAIGGLIPSFTFILTYFLSKGKENISLIGVVALLLLIAGSVIFTLRKDKFVTLKSLELSAISAFFFSLSFVLSKYVYMSQPFWSGFILIKLGGFLMALIFILSKKVREEVFVRQRLFKKRTAGIFISDQAIGAGANILENWAIALAPLVYISVINALQGIQYVFLLIFTVFLSLKFPKILKEEISRKVIFQKIIAVSLIGLGLFVLTLR